jgi:hypothetical protein
MDRYTVVIYPKSHEILLNPQILFGCAQEPKTGPMPSQINQLHLCNLVSIYWHIYVLGDAYFVWPWKSRVPYRDIVTSQRGHLPLLIRTRYVCTCVGAGSWMGGGIRKIKAIRWGAYYYSLVLNVQHCNYDTYKSSLRHIHDPVLSSLKMNGIRLLLFIEFQSALRPFLSLLIVIVIFHFDMDMSYARMVRTASLTSYPVRCKM